jgi:hypothetical protein
MGFALFGSSSESRSYVSNVTQTWNDSFNQAYSAVRTYENVGNPTFNLSLPGLSGGVAPGASADSLLYVGLTGLLVVGGLVLLSRSG